MYLHLLIFTTFLQPKTNFYGLNNGTNVTDKDVSRNESHPFYNIDQDYSNMTNFYRLPPFLFKRDVDEFPATVVTTERTEQSTPSIQATIRQQMTKMTKKIADDIAENLVLNIPLTKNQTRMADNDTTNHVNSTQQLVTNLSLVDVSLASVPAPVVTTKRTEQITRSNNATAQQHKNDMVKNVAESIAKNRVLNITTPKNQTRMARSDTTHHANSTQQHIANSSLVNLSLTSVSDSFVSTKRTEEVTPFIHATTHQQMNDMAKKTVNDIVGNLVLNVLGLKNQTQMAGNETSAHANSTQHLVANSSLVDVPMA